MTTDADLKTEHWAWPVGFLCLQALMITLDRWWPDLAAVAFLRVASFCYFSIWFGLKIRSGYRRRRPHWTRDSWLRYLRLAAMPVVAIVLTLLLSSIDMSSNVLGAPRSPTRAVAALTIIAMMLLGVQKGDPSEQFTRTRWFERRPSN